MAEGIGEGDAFRTSPLDALTFLPRPRLDRPVRRLDKIIHDEVDMHRRPVPRVAAHIICGTGKGGPGGVNQKIDDARGPAKLGHIVIKGAAEGQSQSGAVELNRRGEFRHVDVHHHAHICTDSKGKASSAKGNPITGKYQMGNVHER